MIRGMPLSRRLAICTALCTVVGCSTLLEFDEEYVLGTPESTGGMGGTPPTECPDGEQDNDGNGTCEPSCTTDDCSGNGTCDDSTGTVACSCDQNFSGDDCASCAEGYAGSECNACAAGYQDEDDDGTCLPECDASTCANDGVCSIVGGAATCTCRPDTSGADCSTTCAAGTAGPACAFRIIYGLDIPVAVVNWDEVTDVPYDVDDAASAGAFDRVAYRLILDDEEAWVEMDAFTTVAAELGMPMDIQHDVAITNATVASFSANQPTVTTPSDGNVEMWSSCYSAGPGEYDWDDDITAGTDCYGCIQVHIGMQPVIAFNRWSSNSGDHELGIGPSPTGNPDYTFEQNAGDYTDRRLEVYVREN